MYKYVSENVKKLVKKGCTFEFQYYKEKYPDETFYIFSFFAERGDDSFGVNVCTEEERIRQKVKDKKNFWNHTFINSFEHQINNPHFEELYNILESTSSKYEFEYDEYKDELFSIYLEALKELDLEGLFSNEGSEGKRENFILKLECDEDKTIQYLEVLNPEIGKWYKKNGKILY